MSAVVPKNKENYRTKEIKRAYCVSVSSFLCAGSQQEEAAENRWGMTAGKD
jgi:hypothetical protein